MNAFEKYQFRPALFREQNKARLIAYKRRRLGIMQRFLNDEAVPINQIPHSMWQRRQAI